MGKKERVSEEESGKVRDDKMSSEVPSPSWVSDDSSASRFRVSFFDGGLCFIQTSMANFWLREKAPANKNSKYNTYIVSSPVCIVFSYL